jgi:hypothetical protein
MKALMVQCLVAILVMPIAGVVSAYAVQESNTVSFAADADIGVSSLEDAPVTNSVTPTSFTTQVGIGTGPSMVKATILNKTTTNVSKSNYNVRGNQPASFSGQTQLIWSFETTNDLPIGVTEFKLSWNRWTYSSEGKVWTFRFQYRVDDGSWVLIADKALSVNQGSRGQAGTWTMPFTASGKKIDVRFVVKDNNNTSKPSVQTYDATATGFVTIPSGMSLVVR